MGDREKRLDELSSDNGTVEDLDDLLYSDEASQDFTDPFVKAMKAENDNPFLKNFPKIIRAQEVRDFSMEYLRTIGLIQGDANRVYKLVRTRLGIKRNSRKVYSQEVIIKQLVAAYLEVKPTLGH
jgi:hypothetical protein